MTKRAIYFALSTILIISCQKEKLLEHHDLIGESLGTTKKSTVGTWQVMCYINSLPPHDTVWQLHHNLIYVITPNHVKLYKNDTLLADAHGDWQEAVEVETRRYHWLLKFQLFDNNYQRRMPLRRDGGVLTLSDNYVPATKFLYKKIK